MTDHKLHRMCADREMTSSAWMGNQSWPSTAICSRSWTVTKGSRQQKSERILLSLTIHARCQLRWPSRRQRAMAPSVSSVSLDSKKSCKKIASNVCFAPCILLYVAPASIVVTLLAGCATDVNDATNYKNMERITHSSPLSWSQVASSCARNSSQDPRLAPLFCLR